MATLNGTEIVSGRNLLANSDVTITRNNKSATVGSNGSTPTVSGLDLNDLIGETLSFSFLIYTPGERDDSLSSNATLKNRFAMYPQIEWVDSEGNIAYQYMTGAGLTLSKDTPTRVSTQAKLTPPDSTHTTIKRGYIVRSIYARPASGNDETWFMSQPKLEIGKVATDWSPAPEDHIVNRVDINGVPVIDLTQDTVDPEHLAEGYTAHDSTGAVITGTMAKAETTFLHVINIGLTPPSSSGITNWRIYLTYPSKLNMSYEADKFFEELYSKIGSVRYPISGIADWYTAPNVTAPHYLPVSCIIPKSKSTFSISVFQPNASIEYNVDFSLSSIASFTDILIPIS